MSKRIALIGHCGPDAIYLRHAVASAARDARTIPVEDEKELAASLAEGIDLAMVNRVLDYGFADSDGIALIGRLRESHPHVKLMLISNYPESQAAAVAAGAVPGFGKRQIGKAHVTQLIRDAIETSPDVANQPVKTQNAASAF